MVSEAQDGPGPEDAALDAAAAETTEAIARLERALERIGRQGHPVKSDDETGEGAARLQVADLAGRLDALIAQLRTALAERPGRE